MSADKYPSMFSRQMEAIVYIFSPQIQGIVFIILIFRCKRDFFGYFPVLAEGSSVM